ncbi:class I SAM-dependent DNA methyltransferase [Gordonia sp. NPDC127522]|uniref:class I SAM-dependent DNA methyltransferase n=1 Tax=Gordonia sp. NPDC127522 TaxID=3345390 RepID=UPI003625B32E
MQPLDDITLASYQARADRYAERTPALGPHLSAYLDSLTALLPAGATVLEVGSGPGRAATYLESTHLGVQRTDATPAFVEMMHADGHDANVLDIRTDDLGGPYDAILATAVLLHLTRSEFETFLHRAHAAITPGGLLAFTVKEGDGSQWSTEKIDLPRRFTYWRERDLRTLMARTGWASLSVSQVRMNELWIFVIARSEPTTTTT